MKRFNDPLIQSRIVSMGELSSGVIHDLYTPLQNLKLCCEILKRDPEFAKKQDFIDDITCSVEQTVTIVDAIRHFLRNPKQGEERTFRDIYENTLVILKPKYPDFNLYEIIDIEPELLDRNLNIEASTGIHILFNIFNLVLFHFKESEVKNPKIIVKQDKLSSDQLIVVRDNIKGAGLERLNRISEFSADQSNWQEDLGFWLISRLIERAGGVLEIINDVNLGVSLKWKLAIAGNIDANGV